MAISATDTRDRGRPSSWSGELDQLSSRLGQAADQIRPGSKPGRLRTAKMGVFQITPLYSNDISDYGINDTSSIDKEITAVVNCQFEIR